MISWRIYDWYKTCLISPETQKYKDSGCRKSNVHAEFNRVYEYEYTKMESHFVFIIIIYIVSIGYINIF